MYSVYTTLNNKLTFQIFKYCILRDYSECVDLFSNAIKCYDNATYKRVFDFCWENGLKNYYKTLHSLKRSQFTRLENHFYDNDLKNINTLIQNYKAKGGVLK